MLAVISGSLFYAAINIRDIVVLKLRLGEGGKMRLAFDDRQTAETAVSHLTEEGFRAWIRA